MNHDRITTNTESAGVNLDDFLAFMPTHSYIFTPSGETWPAASVNARIPPVPIINADGSPKTDKNGDPINLSASAWLDRHRPVEQMTWSPGHPMLIKNRLISDGGWIARPGVTCFNLYRAPVPRDGDASEAGPWVDHLRLVYGNEADHIIKWLAHRVQKPGEKINHALVLGGKQGIGKDTLLEPIKHAIGPWNFADVTPKHLLGRFNGFAKSVVMRISEAHDLGDVDRFAFYDTMKIYTAAPPDVLRVDEKHMREYAVFNVMGVIITTNHKSDGIYLPADDRRHFVTWSDKDRSDFSADYWTRLYQWYENGGIAHVAAYLATVDISAFDAKAPPPKTEAFWDIVNANRAPENSEIADVLDGMGNPDALTIDMLANASEGDFTDWLRDRKNRRKIPHRMEEAGYAPIRNPDAASDGLWKIRGKRQAVYARADISIRDQFYAARKL
ncbi:DUF5906 domain-containing protein [Sinorhizobium fredii]|uniref:primase-helicase family protein n=1 Tax=Rhizobium fredii TaxID=380 RepID=UPI0030B75BDC